MSLLKKRLLPLRTIALRYIARNLELFWKKKWDPELQEVTEASDDILLNLPPVLRLEIYLFSSKHGLLDIKALLLLLDHNSLSGSIDYRTKKMFDLLNERYVSTLLARRCKRSTTLSLDNLSFATEPSFAQVLGTFTDLTSLRLHSREYTIINVIGTSLHNLEELFLHHIHVSDLKYENHREIECFVAGCPKLKILHVDWKSTSEALQYVLLGLSNLIEFKHPDMVFALEQIIQKGKADRVSAIRNLYISKKYSIQYNFTDFQVSELVRTVVSHLSNITRLDIDIPSPRFKSSLISCLSASSMINLTEVTLTSYKNYLPLVIESISHQLKLLDLSGDDFPTLEVIDECRKLRVLRLTQLPWSSQAPYLLPQDKDFFSDLQEDFTPFQHLQELHLIGLDFFHFKAALFKSLIASPVLQDLKLVSIPMVTDHILRAAFNHMNQDGEQLAFTSLRRLEIEHHYFRTNYLIDIVSHDRVPLELLVLIKCQKKLEVNLGRFAVKTIYDKGFEYYFGLEFYSTY